MLTRNLTLALAFAGTLALLDATEQLAWAQVNRAAIRSQCGQQFVVNQRSFKRLAAPNAYVWVNDINSNFIRGYSPFDVTVVVGNAYPLFRTEEGQMQPKDFDQLLKGAYGMTSISAQVSESSVKQGLALRFTAQRKAFELRVLSVTPSRGGEDYVTLLLCQ